MNGAFTNCRHLDHTFLGYTGPILTLGRVGISYDMSGIQHLDLFDPLFDGKKYVKG